MRKTARRLKNGLGAAIRGLRETLIKETSFKTMVFIAVFVVAAMFFFPTTRTEKISLLLMIFAVLGLELVNSAIERFLNIISPEHNEKVRIVKDLMAAIVLVASTGAAIIGLMIFGNYIF